MTDCRANATGAIAPAERYRIKHTAIVDHSFVSEVQVAALIPRRCHVRCARRASPTPRPYFKEQQ